MAPELGGCHGYLSAQTYLWMDVDVLALVGSLPGGSDLGQATSLVRSEFFKYLLV